MTDLLDRLRAATNDADKQEAAAKIEELQTLNYQYNATMTDEVQAARRRERQACAREVENLPEGLSNSEIAAKIRAGR